MAERLPVVYLVRHGETAWTLSGQHTGRTDIPLTPAGEASARKVVERLKERAFASVLTSPSQRARKTCELAGYGAHAEVVDDLAEWHYGDYEGLTTKAITAKHPGWGIFTHGAPGGESVADVTARAGRVTERLRAVNAAGGDVLVFSSGHFLRALAARWCGHNAAVGATLLLSTASLSILGYDHGLDEPAIRLWNDTTHPERAL